MYFICRCDCGREKEISAINVRRGNTKTCGSVECIRKLDTKFLNSPDYTGKKFNNWTVLSQFMKEIIIENKTIRRMYFNCRCDCGLEKEIEAVRVKDGSIKTCGATECKRKINRRIINHPDYTGQKFNYLTVLSQFRKEDMWYFHCRCDCGREKDIYKNSVLRGDTKTCGADECIDKLGQHPSRRKDLTGRTFGRLKVIKLVDSVLVKKPSGHHKRKVLWLCKCSCGKTHIASSNSLSTKNTLSCGCYNLELAYKKIKESPLQKSWIDDTLVLGDLMNMGYRENGRKIGVFFMRRDNKYKWIAKLQFQYSEEVRYFNTYHEALAHRLKFQKKVSLPFVLQHKHLLPEDTDIKFWINLNRHVVFDHEQYAREIMAKHPLRKTSVEARRVMRILKTMGYKEDGCKIGVNYHFHNGKYKWSASCICQKKVNKYFFDNYDKALKKRLMLQKTLFMPIIKSSMDILPDDIDINYWLRLNRNVKFDPQKHERDVKKRKEKIT